VSGQHNGLKSYTLKLFITHERALGNETVDLLIREITYYDSRLNVFPLTVFLLFTTVVLHNASFVNLVVFKQPHDMGLFCAIILINSRRITSPEMKLREKWTTPHKRSELLILTPWL
jgi:hypothetical protein